MDASAEGLSAQDADEAELGVATAEQASAGHVVIGSAAAGSRSGPPAGVADQGGPATAASIGPARRLEQARVDSRYAGAMLLHAFFHRKMPRLVRRLRW